MTFSRTHFPVTYAISTILAVVLGFGKAQAGDNHAPSSPQDVLTYHGDNLRTGWYSNETTLTVANVTPSTFGVLHVILLDARIDAQPLYVYGQAIDGQGLHNVVYVATENNSVYAIDGDSGVILWHTQFGIPVTWTFKNYNDNVFPVVGILGTPVIDRNLGRMYFVSDSIGSPSDIFRLHAISLSNGHDVAPPVVIAYSGTLADGTQWTFNALNQLQRAGLLEANGSIYVPFGSTGDYPPDQSRGTILRYDAATLTPITGDLTNRLHQTSQPFYLSSIWQSGYAPAADAGGDIYFSTGNSSWHYPSYSADFNRPDSMLRLSSDLLTLKDSFTTFDYFMLDQNDSDVGSGGMMLLPDQPGSIPHLAIAGGKDGRAFLLNRDNLGGYTQGGPNNAVWTVIQGGCWCGPAYFVGADSAAHILTGGARGVTSWRLQTSPPVELISETSTGSGPVSGLPDNGGVVPVVSSNGTTAGSGIVWFIQRPSLSSDMQPGTPVTLRAFNAANLSQQLISILGGTWTHAVNSNANVVPVVANGTVYVASNRQLRIYGLITHERSSKLMEPPELTPSQPDEMVCPAHVSASAAFSVKAAEHEVYGRVCGTTGSTMQVALRGGHSISIAITHAFDRHRPVVLTAGRPVHVSLTIDKSGLAHALKISPAHAMSPLTPADR